MSKFSRDKGGRREREAVNRFKAWGLHAERNITQVRDGGHDIDLYLPSRKTWEPIGLNRCLNKVDGAPIIGEMKAHKALNIKRVRDWLGENDWLLLDEDHKERLYVLPERIFKELVK